MGERKKNVEQIGANFLRASFFKNGLLDENGKDYIYIYI